MDASSLDAAQVETLKARLESLQVELARQLEDVERGSRPVELDEPIGRLSRMDAMQQQQMAAANASSVRRRLGQIGRALAAIDEGRYGECLRCEEPIELRRLMARPESPRCLRCQGASER